MFLSSDDRRRQRGVILLFMAMMLLVLLTILGLIIDLARLEYAHIKLQNIADAAALAGVVEFHHAPPPPPGDRLTEQEWRDSKYAALATLSGSDFYALDSNAKSGLQTSQSLRLLSGTSTAGDDAGYKHISGSAGNFSVTIQRAIQCFKDTGELLWVAVDNNANHNWCKANSVKVDLKVTGLNVVFTKLLKLTTFQDVYSSATAVMDAYPFQCGRWTCAELSLDNNGNCLFAGCCPNLTEPP